MAGIPGSGGARPRRLPLVLLVTGLAALVVSSWAPYDRTVWWAETLPVSVGALLLLLTYRRCPLSTVSYVIVWVFALILVVGGYYTYARVPLGEWAQDAFGLARNHYDRLGHFFQGVVPALLARELLVRTSGLRPGGWLFTACTSVALAVSALYELVEWVFAEVFGGPQAADFLGSQGDIWDAQKDMLMALLGAMSSLLLFGRLQQRQIDRLSPQP
jgi:putative membrane protein